MDFQVQEFDLREIIYKIINLQDNKINNLIEHFEKRIYLNEDIKMIIKSYSNNNQENLLSYLYQYFIKFKKLNSKDNKPLEYTKIIESYYIDFDFESLIINNFNKASYKIYKNYYNFNNIEDFFSKYKIVKETEQKSLIYRIRQIELFLQNNYPLLNKTIILNLINK